MALAGLAACTYNRPLGDVEFVNGALVPRAAQTPKPTQARMPVPARSYPATAIPATGRVSFVGNLDSRTPVTRLDLSSPPNYVDAPASLKDEAGLRHNVLFRFLHTDENDWDWEALAPDDPTFLAPDGSTGNPVLPNLPVPAGDPIHPEYNSPTLWFESHGRLVQKHPSAPGRYDAGSIELRWQMSDRSQHITNFAVDVGAELKADGLTQLAAPSHIVVTTP